MTRVMVTMRSIRDPATDELRDSLSHDWVTYLDDNLDVTAVPIANDLSDPVETLEELSPDALLLTNGEDLGAFRSRDRTERALIDAATDAGLPVLGVCRGHQVLNDYYGGDVVTIDTHRETTGETGQEPIALHGGTEHAVEVRDGPIATYLPDRIDVNSYHDDGVLADSVAPALETFAVTEDGEVVEGLYHPDRPVLSIQWHPERPVPERPPVDRLIADFLRGAVRW